ncbi:hypothetical protein Q5P01_000068 [Channa striata]|uniref:Uncharacterized protein n=1 Tax=Channa striata TaxID=64152 RepID=A0AA88LFE7_CHASR|nr:hypothetical protein Q5P01_000068 [Channa striata]
MVTTGNGESGFDSERSLRNGYHIQGRQQARKLPTPDSGGHIDHRHFERTLRPRVSSRGYACLRVALPSIGRPALPRLGQSQALLAFVPLSADLWDARRRRRARVCARACRPRRPPSRRLSLLPFGLPVRARRVGRGCGGPLVSVLTALRVLVARRGPPCGCAGFSLGVGTQRRGTTGPVRRPPPPSRAGYRGPAREPPRPGPGATTPYRSRLRPQIRRDDPLNLSILLSGGKETNQDSLSSGERRGREPSAESRPAGGRGKCGVTEDRLPGVARGLSPSDRGSARGRCEAGNGPRRAGVRSSRSRVVWECSPKRVSARGIQLGGLGTAARWRRIPSRDLPPGAGWPSPGAFPGRCARDRLWVGLERQVGGGWRPRRQLLPLPAPRRFLGPWTKCSLRPLSPRGGTGPPAPGATVDRGGLSSVRPNRVASPGRDRPRKKSVRGLRRCRQPTRPVLKHGPRSLTRARVRGLVETPWRNESEGRRAPAEVGSRPRRGSGAPPARLARTVGEVERGACDRTRKMVNYAWAGRSQRKLWWRPVAVLTCKSVVRPGYRGERLIEPSSSWFPPKFPSG